MHPKQSEFLASTEEQLRTVRSMLREQLDLFVRPDRYGVLASLGGGALALLTSVSLVALEVNRVLMRRLPADKWDIIAKGRTNQPPPDEKL